MFPIEFFVAGAMMTASEEAIIVEKVTRNEPLRDNRTCRELDIIFSLGYPSCRLEESDHLRY